MIKQLIIQTILLAFLGYHALGQCPVAIGATLVNVVDSGGDCTFDVEVDYANGGSNNSSIQFTVSICGGAELLTTSCIEKLENSQSPFNLILDDPALVAPCASDICVTYTAWNSPNCNGNTCSPDAPGNEVPLLGSLPIELMYFKGHQGRFNAIELEWITESETDNDYFAIEHSMDGRNFSEIAKVDGSGTISTETYYSFSDPFPAKGENYYRLKQVNHDESFEYTNTISVLNNMEQEVPLTLAPSVAENEVNLVFRTLPKENATIEVFHHSGQHMENTVLSTGNHILTLDISAYLPGMYFIRVPIDHEFVVKKFVKVSD